MESMNEIYDLNLHHLEIFHRVVQEGSVSRAARSLGVSQPAVSKELKELELRTGLALLERLPRGVRATEAGRELHRHAAEVFSARDRAVQAMRDRLRGAAGRVAVGASRTIGAYVLPGLLARHRALRPVVEVRPEVGNTSRVEAWLEEGRIDVGLVEGRPSPHLEQGVFGVDELVAVVSPGLLRGAVPATLAEFCRHPLVVREKGSGTRELVDRALSAKGIRVEPFASLDSTETVRAFAEAGLGAAFLPRAAVGGSIGAGRLVEARLRDSRMVREFRWVLWPARPRGPAVEGFLDLVRGTESGAPHRRGRLK